MCNFNSVLNSDESAVFALRSLYKKYGYSQYRMKKFEEYDLYAKNKDFLVSDNVITFTDTDGKLLALKPDVTLSIIKNGKDNLSGIKKVFYDEHVYRVSKGTRSFKEILQTGLECVGDVDDYCIIEVLTLAAKSLQLISDKNVLDLSHLGIVKAVAEFVGIRGELLLELFTALGEKNAEGVNVVCQKAGVSKQNALLMEKFVTLYGSPDTVKGTLSDFCVNQEATTAVNSLITVIDGLSAFGVDGNVRIDFSVVNDLNYYNGVVFKGFVEGLPTGILSGGQYDNLMNRMGRKSKAIGFAVYLDGIEKLVENDKEFDVDTFILYDKNSDLKKLTELVQNEVLMGRTVVADKCIPEKLKYKNIIELDAKEGK